MPRTHLPVSKETWRAHYRDVTGEPVRAGAHGSGISVDIPQSIKRDPDAGPKWLGYLLGEFQRNLLPRGPYVQISGKTLTIAFRLTGRDVVYNMLSDPTNLGGNLPGFTPFLKKRSFDMNGETDRWWSETRWVLNPSIKVQRLKISLDPATWFTVNGEHASADRNYLNAFYETLAQPTYYGMTFGGGSFAGHGVCCCGGVSTFEVLDIYTE